MNNKVVPEMSQNIPPPSAPIIINQPTSQGLSQRQLKPSNFLDPNDPLNENGEGSCAEDCAVCVAKCQLYTNPVMFKKSFKTIAHYERAVVFRLGRLRSRTPEGPGLVQVDPILETMIVQDTRQRTLDLPKQYILTKDTVTIVVDAVINWSIFDPILATTRVEDIDKSTTLLASAELRNSFSSVKLSDILEKQKEIADVLLQKLDIITDPWGVKIHKVTVKQVKLPFCIEQAFAVVSLAEREAKARMKQSNGEREAARDLCQAANTIGSGKGMTLRYLQTMTEVGAKNNHTILLPIDADLLANIEENGLKNIKLNVDM